MKLERKFGLYSGVDFIPLINIFLILFIFYLIYPLTIKPSLFGVKSLDSNSGKDCIIFIRKTGPALINADPVRPGMLGPEIKGLYIRDTNINFVIRAEKGTPVENVMTVLDTLRLAGVRNIRLAGVTNG